MDPGNLPPRLWPKGSGVYLRGKAKPNKYPKKGRVAMATAYALRVHEIEGHERALEFVKQTGGHLVIRHQKDESDECVHWHALFYSALKVETLRARLVKAAPEIKSNKCYSLKVCDNVEIYERYMCHGTGDGDLVDVVSSAGLKYSQGWAQIQNKVWWSTRKEIAKTKAKNKSGTMSELLQRCRKQQLTDATSIARECVEMFKEQERPINIFYCRGIVNGVWAKLGGPEAASTLAQLISQY